VKSRKKLNFQINPWNIRCPLRADNEELERRTSPMFRTPNRRIAVIALVVLALDQLTKALVLRFLGYAQEKVVVEGFFKFVHWGNTGAAWSLFRGNNELLAVIALVALLVLFLTRHHFDSKTTLGQIAFGLIFGGIMGNLVDRLHVGHVVDFIYFYVQQRGGGEIGFPAFNIADSAICVGVGLIFFNTWRSEHSSKPDGQARPTTAAAPQNDADRAS
jgi:signal peptidase II